MIEIRTRRIDFPSREDFGPQTEGATESFSNRILSFAVLLTGYEIKFDNADHEFHLAQVDAQGAMINDTTVGVTCTLGLRDDSGDWDDHYSGYIAYSVIADVQP